MNKYNLYWLCNSDTISSYDIEENNNENQKFILKREVQLVKLKSGDFQVTQIGIFKPILSGYDYILIPKDLAQKIKIEVLNQVEIRDVRIFRKATNEEWMDYSEITIKNEFLFEKYNSIIDSEVKIYNLMNSMIYISSSLKLLLKTELTKIKNIKLVQGLPIFGGK